MQEAGIDTSAVVRAGMVSFMEGATLYGTFHGDLHGGNLFVMPDGRVALLDFGITGRLDEAQRLSFLKLLLAATVNDVRLQIEALCELGALPTDVDVDSLMIDLGVEQAVVDVTTMTAEELTAQIRELTKALLSYGARLPKELMLFVKNMLFLDAAMATLAPDVDLFAELTYLANYFATEHGDRITKDVGIDPRSLPVDLEGVKASMGVTPDVQTMTYRELQARRDVIRRRMEDRQRHNRRGWRRRRQGP